MFIKGLDAINRHTVIQHILEHYKLDTLDDPMFKSKKVVKFNFQDHEILNNNMLMFITAIVDNVEVIVTGGEIDIHKEDDIVYVTVNDNVRSKSTSILYFTANGRLNFFDLKSETGIYYKKPRFFVFRYRLEAITEVKVLQLDGLLLDPCHPAVARKLLDSDKARVEDRSPWTIRLNYNVKENLPIA
jgi:hypothetical protein